MHALEWLCASIYTYILLMLPSAALGVAEQEEFPHWDVDDTCAKSVEVTMLQHHFKFDKASSSSMGTVGTLFGTGHHNTVASVADPAWYWRNGHWHATPLLIALLSIVLALLWRCCHMSSTCRMKSQSFSGSEHVGLRLVALDVLRGLLVLQIVFYHAKYSFSAPGQVVDLLGGTAVSTFLLLSGFLFAMRHADDENSPEVLSRYWAAQTAKLMPLFIIFEVVHMLMSEGSYQSPLGQVRCKVVLPLLLVGFSVSFYNPAFFWNSDTYASTALRLLLFFLVMVVAYLPFERYGIWYLGTIDWYVGNIFLLMCIAPLFGARLSMRSHALRIFVLIVVHLLWIGLPSLVTQIYWLNWTAGANCVYYFRFAEFFVGTEAWRLCKGALANAHLTSWLRRLTPIAIALRISVVVGLVVPQILWPNIFNSSPFYILGSGQYSGKYYDAWSLMDLIGILIVVPIDAFLVACLVVNTSVAHHELVNVEARGEQSGEQTAVQQSGNVLLAVLEGPLSICGTISYALYLCHMPVISYLEGWPGFTNLPQGGRIVVTVVVSLLVAVLAHYGLHVPLSRHWSVSWSAQASTKGNAFKC
mmetsp:Transcript_3819/g.7860  ORF Transcript_3819/g.7860 Transcript_3819/m.7860 type:complete len:586 (-) Transcript_3819:228-1985(-)